MLAYLFMNLFAYVNESTEERVSVNSHVVSKNCLWICQGPLSYFDNL